MTSAWLGADMSKAFARGPEPGGVTGCLKLSSIRTTLTPAIDITFS
jgi:hypothetical protein